MLYQVSPFGRHDKALIIKGLFGFLATLEILNVNPIRALIIDIVKNNARSEFRAQREIRIML
jgi:hypothetical protein